MSDGIRNDIEKIERALNIRLDDLTNENHFYSNENKSIEDKDLFSLFDLAQQLNKSLQRILFDLSEHFLSLTNFNEEKENSIERFSNQIFDSHRPELIRTDESVRQNPSIQSIRRSLQKEEKSRLSSTEMTDKILGLVLKQIPQTISNENHFDETTINWNSIVDQLNSNVHEENLKRLWRDLCFPKLKSSNSSWKKDDDEKLFHLVDLFGSSTDKWILISSHFPNRSSLICAQRYFTLKHRQIDQMKFDKNQSKQLKQLTSKHRENHYVPLNRIASDFGFSLSTIRREWRNIDPDVRRGQWNSDEDKLLMSSVEKQTNRCEINWNFVSSDVPGRSATKCFHRFAHLNRRISSNRFDKDEDQLLIEQHRKQKGRWAQIQQKFPDRSSYTLQNRWRKLNQNRQRNLFFSQLNSNFQKFLFKCFPNSNVDGGNSSSSSSSEPNLYESPRIGLTLIQLKQLESNSLLIDYSNQIENEEKFLFPIGIRQFLNFLKNVRHVDEIRIYFSSQRKKRN